MHSSSSSPPRLDQYGICSRSGFHCAPLAHKKLNTGESGAVRLSFGIFNTPRELEEVRSALTEIAGNEGRGTGERGNASL